MAAVDAYAPCPCGSGEKSKWCCQKAESYLDRAERLDRNGQHEAALGVVNDGLQKFPDVALLTLRKAFALADLNRRDEAADAIDDLLRKRPDHFGALLAMIRLLLESGEVAAAAGRFQSALARAETTELKARYAVVASMIAATMLTSGFDAAGLKHLELASRLNPEAEAAWAQSMASRARANPSVSAWVKNPYRLAPAPQGLGDDAKRRFDEALGWAEEGLWSSAASAFELLSADPAAAPAANRNLAFCRLWTADADGAAEALARALADPRARSKPTTDEVDLEALRQTIDVRPGDDPVEEVELSWPIRDRDGLLERLAKSPLCVEAPQTGGEDGEASRRPESFLLLDRPKLAGATPGLKPSDLPLVVGKVTVGADAVVLSTRDDGRLNATIDGFTAAADRTIPPAHPRTRVVGSIPRADVVLDVLCYPPTDLDEVERQRLTTALLREQVDRLWPETPMAYLGGKTPAAAAKAGGFELPLRAAMLLLEESGRDWTEAHDWSGLRSRVSVPAEPPIDHSSVKIEELHLGRLALLDPLRLDDDRLISLFQRSREWGLPDVVRKAAREITARPRILSREGFGIYEVFAEVALNEAEARKGEAALEWVRKGKGVDPRARTPIASLQWDMLEVQVRIGTEEPEAWVPELVAVIGRYERDESMNRLLIARLAQMGLVRLVPTDDHPGGMALDSSLLEFLISRYGPRVRTAAGEVGVSAARGSIWTPDAPASGGGIWTPGSDAAASPAEKPRIILPGQ